MKASSCFQLAAAGVFSLAALAIAAPPECAIDCLPNAIDGRIEECKDDTTVYVCFCKSPNIQRDFMTCADTMCKNVEEKQRVTGFTADLCDGIGSPVDTGKLTEPAKTDGNTAIETSLAKTTKEGDTTTTEAAGETSEASDVETTSTVETGSAIEITSAAETTSTVETITTAITTETSKAEETTSEEVGDEKTTVAPSASADTTDSTEEPASTPTSADANAANSGSVPGFLAAAGIAAAVLRFV
ncbi:hypothetical protein FZEAL_8115 [Fusarium zealandicum]|uniref:CFEM domain-containing protein n=1 Tax=Fusarium zealandicum TaxID=1053134 RepID=A0A8H4UF42_9HYPO|nr:hypothetical protein FZEAL_8115 [Fusarium zealandicum]